AEAVDAHHLAALQSALEGVRDRAVQRRHLDVAAQGRLAEGDRHLADEVVAVALEQRVLADAGDHVQVAAGRAGVAGLALAADPDAGAVVHAGRHVDLQRPPGLDPAAAVAVRTGVGDDLAAAAAAGTGLLQAEEALVDEHRPLAAAAPAHRRLG